MLVRGSFLPGEGPEPPSDVMAMPLFCMPTLYVYWMKNNTICSTIRVLRRILHQPHAALSHVLRSVESVTPERGLGACERPLGQLEQRAAEWH